MTYMTAAALLAYLHHNTCHARWGSFCIMHSNVVQHPASDLLMVLRRTSHCGQHHCCSLQQADRT